MAIDRAVPDLAELIEGAVRRPHEFTSEPGFEFAERGCIDRHGHAAKVLLGSRARQRGFQAEALAWSPEGTVVKAVEPRNRAVPLPERGPFQLYLEGASNPDVAGRWTFAPTALGEWETAGDVPIYVLGRVDIALLDVTVWDLVQDIWTLRGLYAELPESLPRRAKILRALERSVDAMDPDDIAGTAALGRQLLAPALASPAWGVPHRIHAVGHAHIDSAWLWPVRRRVRGRVIVNKTSSP